VQRFIAKALLADEIETMEYLYGTDTTENLAAQPRRTLKEVNV
jgi:hypothetical protein